MDRWLTLWESTALAAFTWGQAGMMLVGALLLYLAIRKKFEPLLLLPIGFGAILANIPLAGLNDPGGILYYIYVVGIDTGVFPLLIFYGRGSDDGLWPVVSKPPYTLVRRCSAVWYFCNLAGCHRAERFTRI